MRGTRDRTIAILMLAPSVVLLGIFVYVFILSTAYTSLTNLDSMRQLGGIAPDFVGLKNYLDFFGFSPLDTRFRIGFVNTIFFTILFIAVCLGLGLLLAVLLDQKIKGEAIFRTIFLFPMALSFVVTGVVWRWLFNVNAGLNRLPTLIGLPQGTFEWHTSQQRILEFSWQDFPTIIAVIIGLFVILPAFYYVVQRRSRTAIYVLIVAMLINGYLLFVATPSLWTANARPETHGFNLAIIAVVVAAAWQMSGYTMAMYLAGLRGVAEELREAARVDGCSELNVYRRIVLPLLAPITLSAMIILGHISLKIFDLIYAMGGGDLLQIDVPGMFMYLETYRGFQPARGAAVAMIMLILVAAVIVPYLYTNLKGEAKK
ncbi:MAG: sugar ABC transporter permease [bacterium]|nr:sugar ABC transporter permease [bacterium]